MTVQGGAKIRRELRRLSRRAPKAMLQALFEEGARIFAESQTEVPVDTGRLRASGLLGVLRSARHLVGPAVVVAYGTSYALRIHEDTGADAGRKRRAEEAKAGRRGVGSRGSEVGKSKYLEDPFLRASFGIGARLAARTRALIESETDAGEPSTVRGKKKKRKKKKKRGK